MRLPVLDRLILSSEKPSRYVGGELNAVRKELAKLRVKWALAFPDTYEVGMSNVGFRLLYHMLNERPDVACDRVAMPWPDMELALKAERQPLFSIESREPLAAFDIVGFTLQFELCYTTVLAMLDLGGIALHARDRKREDPLILGGGPCTYNAEPVADFFDAFVIGEGEELVHEISDAVADWKRGAGSREDLLWLLAEIPGVYVPSLFRPHYNADRTLKAYEPLKPGYESIVRRVIPDLNLVPQAEKPIVPFMQTVHDRLPLEIQRGCTRGCRFCQVGMITRPTRQRDPNQVRRIAETGLLGTGYEEVGFLSLSAGDYSCINGVLEDFFDEFGAENVGISLPSLRTETMNARLAEQIGRVRKSGFTVAPEAATERMRRVINKGNAEKDLLHAVDTIFQAGWELVKFYFMIGLPTERDEDVRAIVRLCGEALRRGKRSTRKAEINVGVSTFCPKPFTPFQWDPMIPLEETRRKHGATLDCASGAEHGTACGACDYEVVDTIVYHPKDYRPQKPAPAEPTPTERTALRLRYAKEGRIVALSHLETMTALLRTFRRAGLSMPHSEGFHPKPKVSFGPACPVGTESHAEYLDLELFGMQDSAEVADGIRLNLPEGFRVVSCDVLRPGGPSLARTIRGITYRVELPEDAPDAALRLAEFAAREEASVMREREGKRPVRIDLKKSVDCLVAENAREIRFTLRAGENEAVARPSELLAALFGTELTRPGVARIVRENAIFGIPAA